MPRRPAPRWLLPCVLGLVLGVTIGVLARSGVVASTAACVTALTLMGLRRQER